MRPFAALLLLSACDAGADPTPPGERIMCGRGATEPSDACTLTRRARDGEEILTLRASDGGFRTVAVARDGVLSAADGAERARVEPLPDGGAQVAIGPDRYRLPPPGK